MNLKRWIASLLHIVGVTALAINLGFAGQCNLSKSLGGILVTAGAVSSVSLAACGPTPGNDPEQSTCADESYPATIQILGPNDCKDQGKKLVLEGFKKGEPGYIIAINPDQNPTQMPPNKKTFSIQAQGVGQGGSTTQSIKSKNNGPRAARPDPHRNWLNSQNEMIGSILSGRAKPPLQAPRGPLDNSSGKKFGKCPPPYEQGLTRCSFKVTTPGSSPQTYVDAPMILSKVTDHALFFTDDFSVNPPVEGNDALSTSEIDGLAEAYEKKVYPTVTQFGDFPDVDQNGKVIIVISNKIGDSSHDRLGYNSPADLFPDGTVKGVPSNEGDIFYVMPPWNEKLNVNHNQVEDRKKYFAYDLPLLFTHELKHLVSINEHVYKRNEKLEELWLEEGSADIAKQMMAQNSSDPEMTKRAIEMEQRRSQIVLSQIDTLPLAQDSYLFDNNSMYFLGFLFARSAFAHSKLSQDGFWKRFVQTTQRGLTNASQATNLKTQYLMINMALDTLYSAERISDVRFGKPYADFGVDLSDAGFDSLLIKNLSESQATTSQVPAFDFYKFNGNDSDVSLQLSCPQGGYFAVVRPSK